MPLFRSRLKTILLAFTIILTLSIIYSAQAFTDYDNDLDERLKTKKFLAPTIFFSAPIIWRQDFLLKKTDADSYFKRQNFREREPNQTLLPGDFSWGTKDTCSFFVPNDSFEYINCLSLALKQQTSQEIEVWRLFLSADQKIIRIQSSLRKTVETLELEPEILAQYLKSEPMMQEITELKDIPPACPNAVMAIEDAQFLEHKGFSVKGTLRGILAPLLKGKKPQGGSTITQQLVKNYFLTNERSVKRKAEELILSILIEKKMTKDQILETYMNIIYMGQNGPFQIIGFGAASKFYFDKKISDLSVDECALLAAVLNGPGVYNPFMKQDKTLQRRNLVLTKMKELNLITDLEYTTSLSKTLPKKTPLLASETAPYYLDAVRKQLKTLSIPTEGMLIYTGINLTEQQIAQESLQKHLAQLEKDNKKIQQNKEKNILLEGVVLSTDHRSGMVQVLVGGRNFRKTQFNRATEAHRQIGSIFKPLVYLTALHDLKSEKDFKETSAFQRFFNAVNPFNPLTIVADESFVWTLNSKNWTPSNYAKKYYGPVPVYYALKNSLNASTALIGKSVGLEAIIKTAQDLGALSELKPFPSLTLGAFEMYPIEVLQIYSTIANFGQKIPLSFIDRVTDPAGQIVFKNTPTAKEVYDPVAISSLIGLLRQTTLSGTAKLLKSADFKVPIAGKTGTTNDYKDTWFAGMTPRKTTLVWVGYDQNQITGLTGASVAVPIWSDFMKTALDSYPVEDFPYPEDKIKRITITKDILKKAGVNTELEPDIEPFELIFDKAKIPSEL